jgi:transcriptional regulator with PAS, ATPase and Fis domain
MTDQEKLVAQLQEQVYTLTRQVKDFQDVETKYKAAFQELGEKEEFNFALFQYAPETTVIVDRDGRVIKSNKAKQRSADRLPKIGDVMYKDYASKHSINMYEKLMQSMASGEVLTFDELAYGDKFLSITIAPFAKGAIITSQDITPRVRAERDRTTLINELRRALDEVETLRGLLPICASCKSIRDDRGYWSTVEDYFSNRSKVDFSHTLCPDCIRSMYPEIWEQMALKKAGTFIKDPVSNQQV